MIVESPTSLKYLDGEKLTLLTSYQIFVKSEIGQNPSSEMRLNSVEYGPMVNGWNILFVEKEHVRLVHFRETQFSRLLEELEKSRFAIGIYHGKSYPDLGKFFKRVDRVFMGSAQVSPKSQIFKTS